MQSQYFDLTGLGTELLSRIQCHAISGVVCSTRKFIQRPEGARDESAEDVISPATPAASPRISRIQAGRVRIGVNTELLTCVHVYT
jgi:hypothetical protein